MRKQITNAVAVFAVAAAFAFHGGAAQPMRVPPPWAAGFYPLPCEEQKKILFEDMSGLLLCKDGRRFAHENADSPGDAAYGWHKATKRYNKGFERLERSKR